MPWRLSSRTQLSPKHEERPRTFQGNRAVSTNLYFREKNFRIFMMRKFRLAEPAHSEGWECKNFSCGQSATGKEGKGAGALMKVHVLPPQSEIVATGLCLGLQAFLS